MAHIAAYQVRTGHFHQLAAAQRADGFQIFRQNAGNRRFAGAGVAGEDHVHIDLGHLQALGLAALLGLHVFGDIPHIIFDFLQTDDAVQLGLHGIHVAAVLLGQQCQQVNGLAAVHGHAQLSVHRRQHGRRALGGCRVSIQHILGNGAVDRLAVIAHGLHTAGLAVLGCQQIPYIRAHGQCQPALLAGAFDEEIQLPRGHSRQRIGGERLGAADIARGGIHELCAEVVRQRGLALVGVEHKVFAARLQFADGPGGQRCADIDKDAALQDVPAGQRQRTIDGQRGQHI